MRRDADVVHTPIARPVAVVFEHVALFGGNVLNERTAQRDVGDLDTTADRERRKSAGERGSCEGKLERIALRVDARDTLMGNRPVVSRVEIFTACSGEKPSSTRSSTWRLAEKPGTTPP